MSFAPKSALFALPSAPAAALAHFRLAVGTIYASPGLKKLVTSGYNPLIIGYEGESTETFFLLVRLLVTHVERHKDRVFGLELRPQQLTTYRDFLRAQKEFQKSNTIGGKEPDAATIQQLTKSEVAIKRHLAGLLFWTLHDLEKRCVALDHPETAEMIARDARKPGAPDAERDPLWPGVRPFYTAIARDLHMIERLVAERPGVICLGFMHALKLDLLLQRDGSRSHYVLFNGFNWQIAVELWERAHRLYAETHSL